MDNEQPTDAVDELAETPDPQEVKEAPDPAELQKRVEALEEEKDRVVQDYKDLQVKHQKAIEEGRITKGLGETLQEMKSRFDNLEMNQAVLYDRFQQPTDEGLYEAPKSSESAVARLEKERQEREQQQREQQEIQRGADAFTQAAKASGLDVNDPELKSEVIATSKTPWEAIDKLPAFVQKRRDAAQAEADKQKQKKEEEEKKESARKEAKENGELEVPTPESAGPGTPFEEQYDRARDAFIKAPSDPTVKAEYMKLRGQRGLPTI